MFHSLLFPGFRTFCLVVFACCLSVSANRLSAQAPPPETPPQDAPAKTDSTAKAPPAPAQTEEVSSHDTPATFKVRVNLVLVRVVGNDCAFRTANHHAYEHQVYAHLKRGRCIVTGDFLSLGRSGGRFRRRICLGRRILRRCFWGGSLRGEAICGNRQAASENYQTESAEPGE